MTQWFNPHSRHQEKEDDELNTVQNNHLDTLDGKIRDIKYRLDAHDKKLKKVMRHLKQINALYDDEEEYDQQ